MTEHRILFVEDDEDYALFMTRMVARLGPGHPFDVVHDERSAVAALAEHQYDVVVSDLELHPGNGVTVLQAARLRSPRAQRILLTSAPDRARRQIRATQDATIAHAVWDKRWEPGTIRAELEHLLQPTV